jgi:excisionase family DNA binding protein
MSPTLVDSDPLKLLTVEDVADLFQVRPRKVYDLVRDEGLPFVRMGRLYRFVRRELVRWQESRTAAHPVPGTTTAAPALLTRDWSRRG